MKTILACVSLMLAASPLFACEGKETSAQLAAMESAKLLENAPTFRHGWEDGEIKLAFEQLQAAAEGCSAQMKLTLPQRDLDEVNTYLDKNPAKRILLGAQGYSVPDSTLSQVAYFYRMQDGKLMALNAQNKALDDLHHSLEFMYQLLAQTRAEVTADSANSQPWPPTLAQQTLQRCKGSLQAEDMQAACGCRLDNLSKKVSPRQMELIDTLLEQPYSAATGALIGYTELSKNINQQCGLKKR